VIDFEVCDELAADRRREVIDLVERVTTRLGHRPLSDHLWLDLLHGDRPCIGGVLALEADRVVGYAQLSPSAGGWVAGAAVEQRSASTSRGLVAGIVDLVGRRGGGAVHWWVLGDDALSDTVAIEAGMAPERAVHQMVVGLPLADARRAPVDVDVRTFRVGSDEAAWLEVNNAAFAGHGEQGGWDVAILGQREREPWFDPAGFLLHERDGRLAAFCWTKLHHDSEPVVGEIYVIAVHPDFHGLGLGRALTLAGLDSIERRGVGTGMLFVDTTNHTAIELYRSLGFTVLRTDHAFILEVPAGVSTPTKETSP
jgi:mycothiol synthase